MSAIGGVAFYGLPLGLHVLQWGCPLALDGDCWNIWGGYPLSHNSLPDGCLPASWCMVADNPARFPPDNVPRSI